MNAAVDKGEHPDRRAHKPDTSPHAQHRSSVVVGLQSRTPLPLSDNDESIEHFIKLANVEPPTPKSESLIPQSTHIRRVRVSIRKVDHCILRLPDIDCSIVGRRIPQTPRSVNLAKRVGVVRETIAGVPFRKDM